MKLVWFEVTGFKRFAKHAKINLNEKLVAIVGPNEAGKTSLLHALMHFANRREFINSGGSQEISRGLTIEDDATVAEWTFAIDDDDRVALASIPEAKNVRWYSLEKRRSGKAYFSLRPRPKRSMTLRTQGRSQIEASIESLKTQVEASSDSDADNGEEAVPPQSRMLTILQELLPELDNNEESLNNSTLTQIVDAAKMSAAMDLVELSELLTELHGYESAKSPADRAGEVLSKRQPDFLFFSREDRNLKSEYDLNKFFLEENPQKKIRRESVPTSLQNLAYAADLDLEMLHEAQSHDDRGKVRTLLEKAESKITRLVQESWTQAKLWISLELDGFRLQVLLRSEEGEYVKVVERSDGLRQYVAPLLFLARQPSAECKPILLIDEAESRLHYDAQADLVQVLAKQALASKVIYTTHSIGCLPEDLGSGIRMVVAEDPYSTIENYFWNSKRPGFSPLLFSMGAQTLAFLPMRYALIAEGAADLILLPALFKVLGLDHIGFQVVPGLSSGDSAEIAILDNESARTAYLTDGDSAGRRMKQKIKEAGVLDSKILTLPKIDNNDAVLEDYVHHDAYFAAVCEELKRSGCREQLGKDDVARPNRPMKLDQWCKAKGVSTPSKRVVAYHLVENQYENALVDVDLIPNLRDLLREIHTALGF